MTSECEIRAHGVRAVGPVRTVAKSPPVVVMVRNR